MLLPAKELSGFAIRTSEGDIGKVKDFYFDDERWVVRYLVVDTRPWFTGKKLLVSPMAAGAPNTAEQIIPVRLTKARIEGSPDLDLEQPLSRDREREYLEYFGYTPYWGGTGLWGAADVPSALPARDSFAPATAVEVHGEPHLRSTSEVAGYHLLALDGEIGHVDDFLIDDHAWAIRYLVIDTSNWIGGKSVLIAPQWVQRVSWTERRVYVNLMRTTIQESPPYDPLMPVSRDYEKQLFAHYNRESYWT